MGKSNKKKKKTFSEILGERIRYFRKKTGLSLRNFGYECDMEKSNLGLQPCLTSDDTRIGRNRLRQFRKQTCPQNGRHDWDIKIYSLINCIIV